MAAASAARRNQRFDKSPTMRMRSPAVCSPQPTLGLSASDGHNPVMAENQRKLLVEAFDERRAVLVQERDKTDRPLLRVTAGKRERLCVDELAPQRLVAPLR